MKRNSLFYLMVCWALAGYGQLGNEWIDFNQSYYKIKIVEDGFYRVTAAELEAQGFPVSSVPANRIQLFRRGEEVAIQVNATGGELNYFEFYGQKNRGEGDEDLYIATDAQPHQEYSLFTDTATYFLTWKLTSETGKRMGFSSLNDPSGLTAEPYHYAENLTLGTSDYAPGIKFGSGASFTLSEYDYGEGWTAGFVSKGGFQQYDLTLEQIHSGDNPVLDMVLIGGNTLQHNVDVEVGPDASNLRNIGNIQFSDRNFTTASLPFNISDIGGSGELVVRINTTGFSGAADRVSTALTRVTYAQDASMSPSENKTFYFEGITPGERAYVRINTTNAAGTDIYDITNTLEPVRITTTPFSDRLECIVPGSTADRTILAVTSHELVADIQAANMTEIDVANTDLLILTHPALRTPASDGLDPIAAYVNYRSSSAGGSYQTEAYNIFDIFDQFNYGDASPLAIRRFAAYAYANGSPEALFLIGKGRTPNRDFYRDEDHSEVNIPTYGDPGGDLMFTKGLGADPYDPAFAVGRLNAFDAEDVKSYLDKVKTMEARAFDDLNRKNVLQLSGGQTAIELDLFKSHIEDFGTVLEGDFLGGKAINVSKETTDAVEVIDVVAEVNEGVGLITFFGHSSGTVTDIEIGRVSDGSFGYFNTNKYPVLLVNGCNAGDIFGGNFTFGEDWMITPDLGALAVIAHADFAASGALKRYSDHFHDVAMAEESWFGSTLGEIITEVSQRYFDQSGTGSLAQTQVLQTLLQSDPMVRLFGAESPDYQVEEESVTVKSFTGGQLLASQDSLNLEIVVKNFGRTVTDSLLVQVRRTLPNGEVLETFREFERPLRQDTLHFTIYNEDNNTVAGVNTFNIILDPANEVPELNETNNTAQVEVRIFRGNTSHLYPPDFSIEPAEEVTFIWQPTDILQPERQHRIEIDTVTTFNSSFLKTRSVNGSVILSTNVDFSADNLADTTVFYWRTRFANPMNEDEEQWEQTSFSLIENNEGWGQFRRGQMEEGDVTGVEFTTGDDWQFRTTESPFTIRTFGADYPGFDYEDLEVIASGIDYLLTSNTIDPECAQNTINALVFDKESTNPYRPIEIEGADVFSDLVCGRLPQMVYNLTESRVLGSNAYLETLIGNMQTGDHMILFNIGDVNYSNWDGDVLSALENIGVQNSDITGLTDGQPLIILGRKGDAPGTATVVSDDGSLLPVTEQSIELNDIINGSFTSGSILSPLIGPAKSWKDFTFEIDEEANDNYTVDVLGVRPDGTTSSLFAYARRENEDLSGVDPQTYPWLKLSFSFSDDTDLTPPQLDFWQVNYESPPEGILLTLDTARQSLVEGQPSERSLGFYNFSGVDFEADVTVSSSLTNASGNVSKQTLSVQGPVAGDTTLVTTSLATLDQGGTNRFSVEAVAEENELYTFNNISFLAEAVEVQADEANPVIDVTFDGQYIMNGDIVSPNPTIVVKMKDDNPFLSKTDTVGLEMQFKESCEGCEFQRINFTDPGVSYTPASEDQDFEISYEPGPLDDGVYALSVQARDASGNLAGTEPYQVDFEVVNESSITHFYPYPNPFSTQTRFVFTLTGSQVPEKMKIQIMTISGRIVREINQNEIGPIKIGHNITQFAWDGTDEYGDQLANGVYFYRVMLDVNEPIEHRETSADGAFKNGFGKLYILR